LQQPAGCTAVLMSIERTICRDESVLRGSNLPDTSVRIWKGLDVVIGDV
jgi:hypothetical protein